MVSVQNSLVSSGVLMSQLLVISALIAGFAAASKATEDA